jgi:hypothetical protein
MSRYYDQIGEVSNEFRAQAIVIARKIEMERWQVSKGANTCYAATFEGQADLQKLSELTDRWSVDIWQSAFFLKLEPSDFIHRHVDEPHPWNSYHIVLLTNDDCINSMYDEDGTEHRFNLEPGGIYYVERTTEHGSVNNGDSERLHLLMEVHDA